MHSVARFQELGFGLSTVTFWAGVSGLIALPGRFLLPMLARRVSASPVLGGVLGVLALATSLMVAGDAYWQMAAFDVLLGVVFGAALPLRAIVMGEWTATAVLSLVLLIAAALVTWSGVQSARFAAAPPVVAGGESAGRTAPRPDARGTRERGTP